MHIQPPAFVTFTGIDEWTDLGRVRALSELYPTEWGILFSPRLQGESPRYPSPSIVDRVTHALDLKVGLAAHLCGRHAAAIVADGRCPDLDHLADHGFGRFQVNTDDPAADPGNVAAFAGAMGGTGIMQCRGTGPHAFPWEHRVAWLYDASGGRGVVPPSWPLPPAGGKLVGYAGGIGPDNVACAMQAIATNRSPAQPYWLDMETHIRTDDRLDLDKCEAVCRAVFGDR